MLWLSKPKSQLGIAWLVVVSALDTLGPSDFWTGLACPLCTMLLGVCSNQEPHQPIDAQPMPKVANIVITYSIMFYIVLYI